MEQYPELTADQLHRLRLALVYYEVAKDGADARRKTATPKQCKEWAINLLLLVADLSMLSDLEELYLADDVPEEKETKRRARGKGKKPIKVMYPIRLEESQLERLKQLGGNVSGHIRKAIDQYLLQKSNGPPG